MTESEEKQISNFDVSKNCITRTGGYLRCSISLFVFFSSILLAVK